MLGCTDNGVAVNVTPAGEYQAVVAAQMNFTVGIFPAHLFRVRDDLLDVTLQEVDAGNVKQGLQRGDQWFVRRVHKSVGGHAALAVVQLL